MLSLIEAHQEVFYRGSDEESHLDNSEESWLFVEREGSLRNVDGAALQDARDVPDDLHQETDLNVGEGDQAAVGYDVVDGNMELMSENNVLAQGILFESKEGRKWDSKIFFFFFFAVAPAIILCVRAQWVKRFRKQAETSIGNTLQTVPVVYLSGLCSDVMLLFRDFLME